MPGDSCNKVCKTLEDIVESLGALVQIRDELSSSDFQATNLTFSRMGLLPIDMPNNNFIDVNLEQTDPLNKASEALVELITEDREGAIAPTHVLQMSLEFSRVSQALLEIALDQENISNQNREQLLEKIYSLLGKIFFCHLSDS